MKRGRTPALLLLALGLIGCAQQTNKVVTVTKDVSIPIQDEAALTITVDRIAWAKEVKIEVQDIPTWLTVKHKKKAVTNGETLTIPKKKAKEKSTTLNLTLIAGKTAPMDEGKTVKFLAASDGKHQEAKSIVTVRNFELGTVGWVVMVVSVGTVLALVSFCLFRVMTLPPVEVEEQNLSS